MKDCKAINPLCRPFDLAAGDRVIFTERDVNYWSKESEVYTVVEIYDRFFTVVTSTGYKTSFTKADYGIGQFRKL